MRQRVEGKTQVYSGASRIRTGSCGQSWSRLDRTVGPARMGTLTSLLRACSSARPLRGPTLRRGLANLGWGPVLRLGVRTGAHLSDIGQGPGHKGVSRVPVQQAGAQQGGAAAGPDRGRQHLPALLRGDEARCTEEGEA